MIVSKEQRESAENECLSSLNGNNWWENYKHWKYRRADSRRYIVMVGFGIDNPTTIYPQADKAEFEKIKLENPEAYNTLKNASEDTLEKVHKYDMQKFPENEWELMLYGAVAPEPETEDKKYSETDALLIQERNNTRAFSIDFPSEFAQVIMDLKDELTLTDIQNMNLRDMDLIDKRIGELIDMQNA